MPNENQGGPEARKERFTTDFGSQAEFSQCLSCVHWQGNRECAAFDDRKVPLEILENSFDHRVNHPEDNGKTWTPDGENTTHPMDMWE